MRGWGAGRRVTIRRPIPADEDQRTHGTDLVGPQADGTGRVRRLTKRTPSSTAPESSAESTFSQTSRRSNPRLAFRGRRGGSLPSALWPCLRSSLMKESRIRRDALARVRDSRFDPSDWDRSGTAWRRWQRRRWSWCRPPSLTSAPGRRGPHHRSSEPMPDHAWPRHPRPSNLPRFRESALGFRKFAVDRSPVPTADSKGK